MADEYITKGQARTLILNNIALNPVQWSNIKKQIGALPAADVRPVVTCEECVWHIDDGTHYCNKWCEPCPDNAEFFCAYGERDNCGADMREVNDAAD